jgi:hypothetical protein
LHLKLLDFDFNVDPDQAFHSDADPDPASKNNADPGGSRCPNNQSAKGQQKAVANRDGRITSKRLSGYKKTYFWLRVVYVEAWPHPHVRGPQEIKVLAHESGRNENREVLHGISMHRS